MAENRAEPRTSIGEFYNLVDRVLGVHIGRVMDISLNGVRILTERQIEESTVLLCKIPLDDDIKGKSEIVFDVSCTWSKKNSLYGVYETGCKIQNLSQKDSECLFQLLEAWGNTPPASA